MDRVKFKTYNIDVKSAQFKNTDQSKKIDINILLNRIKIEEKNTFKKKLTFFTLAISSVCIVGTLLF